MLTKKEQKLYILRKISGKLNDLGFHNKVKGQSFLSKISIGMAMIHLGFIDHENDFDVTISVSIRVDQVEDIINKSNDLLKKTEQLKTSTIGCELGNLETGNQKRFSIYENTKLDSALEEMIGSIVKTAFPFIKKYSELDNIYNIVKRDDKESWWISSIHHKRAQTAIILAKNLNKEDFEIVLNTKRVFLENRNDYGLELYLRLCENINKI